MVCGGSRNSSPYWWIWIFYCILSTQEHHYSNEASQVKFFNDVRQLKKAFDEFGNPFLGNGSDLISFGTNILASKEQIKCLYQIKVAGK